VLPTDAGAAGVPADLAVDEPSLGAGGGAERPLGASPTRIADPKLRLEAARAAVWVGVVGLAVLAIYISQSLLVIFGAMVFAAMIDGGARLLGRVLPIGRGWRISIVLVAATAFFVWLAIFAGSQISQEAAQFPEIVNQQAGELIVWLRSQGFAISGDDVQGLVSQLMSGVGTVTRALGGIFGGVTTLVLILIIGIYIALEPRLYERGLAWMLPVGRRAEFHSTVTQMAATMRRLMFGRIVGMVFEGIITYIALAVYGVPMAALLAILTGLLAFIPNVGAFVSGILMVLVGFSGGLDMGLYTIGVYFVVQTFDGYLVIPMIAKKTVDLAPALVLAAQLVMGILFGILGLFLADPLMAMIKVALERRSRSNAAEQVEGAPAVHA
jgi:predicted PurR-regulated permease PerM